MADKEVKGADSILGLSDITENKTIWRMIAAEFLGTFLLVLVGCASILLPGEVDTVRIAFTFGITLATLIQSIGHISGCHINPAVTLSFFATGDVKLIKSLLYIVAQMLGAVGGAAVLRVIVPDDKEGGLGITNVGNGLSDVQGFLLEVILTFLFISVIHSVCDPRRKDIFGAAPLAIGLTLTTCHLAGVPYSGSSLNPARSFGPAVIIDFWENHWIYWAGPLIGGVAGGLVHKYVFKLTKSDSESYDF